MNTINAMNTAHNLQNPHTLHTLISTALLALASLGACASAQAAGGFTGTYRAAYTNTAIAAEIVENQSLIRGTFYMDGDQYKIIATSQQNTFRGKILDESKGKFYDVASQLQGHQMRLSITLPELNNKVVDLQLTKLGAAHTPASNPPAAPGATAAGASPGAGAVTATPAAAPALNNKEKNPRLVGTWRYTEVLSSGMGGNHASLATDYFVQFKPNGECLSWTGSSAGGSAHASIESRGQGQVTREEWYTEGKNVVFVNPQTREEVSLAFFAEDHRMMLKGSSSKVFQRVASHAPSRP